MKLCIVCEMEIDSKKEDHLTCDDCDQIICLKGVGGLANCWREHVLQEHGIDYTIQFRINE